MKKLLDVTWKILLFFFTFALLGGLIEIPSDDPAIWRFGAEIIPLIVVIAATLVFVRIEKGTLQILNPGIDKNELKSTLPKRCFTAAILGLSWYAIPTIILTFMRVIKLEGPTVVSMLWLWLLSLFLNSIMQELLIRGYMYQLIKREYGIIPAILFTTILFTVFHGGAFEAGPLAVVNVVTMSLAMSIALEATGTLLVPMLLHGIYNLLDGIIIGTGTVVEYPHLYSAIYSGPNYLTGGDFGVSGSIFILIANTLLAAIYLLALIVTRRGKSGTL